ncbi:MAG TPA: hypothetical protein PKI19_11455 [Elusimicrobiales bacterium]|nr:hypothetical protein [Elusimicrobiales bacterium]
MKNLLNAAALAGLLCAQAGAAPLLPANFKYTAAVGGEITGGKLYRVDLPAAVLRNCSPDQADIRLFAPDGGEVPGALIKMRYARQETELLPAELTGYTPGTTEATLELKLSGELREITALNLETQDRDFLKQAEVYGASDGKSWRLLGSGTIYDFSSQVDLRRTELAFPRASYRFYRVKLRDAEKTVEGGKSISLKYEGLDFKVSGMQVKKLKIDGVRAQAPGAPVPPDVYDEGSFAAAPASETEEGTSGFEIAAGLPFDQVEFSIEDKFFVRDFTAYYSATGAPKSFVRLGGGNIRRFPPGWPEAERAWAQIYSPGYAYYRFVFRDKNNPPLRLKSVRLKWLRRSVYFIAPSDMDRLTLAFGRPGTPPPAYDTANFINQDNWHQREAAALRLGEPAANKDYNPEPPASRKGKAEKGLLIAVIIVIAAGMGFWLYKLLGQAAASQGGKTEQ